MIEIKDLSLTFKNADEDHEALKAVTLDIPEGCIYGFVGSNGAGKSTTINIMCGQLAKDSGSISICDTDMDKDSDSVKPCGRLIENENFRAVQQRAGNVNAPALSAGEFTKAVGNEKSARNRKVGTAQQRKNWGENSAKNPYTSEDYDELDRIYEALSSDLMAAGGVSVKQEFILRDCAKMTLDRDKMRAIGQYDKAAKLNKMVQDNLSSEGLRKRDAKPIDDLRIDGIVDRLEKAGLLKNGKQCSPDEMFEILFHRRPKYSYTKDAAEQILLYMANTTRVNDGLSELPTLPPDMRLRDDLGEFAEEPDEQEKESYKELGIVKMPPVKKK